MTSLKYKKVGYWVSDKKYIVLNIKRLESVCKDNRIDLIKLDLDEDFENQGPFDLIFHKMTDLLFKCNNRNITFNNFQEYTLKHPEIPIIDPIHHILPLFQRSYLHQILIGSSLFNDDAVFFIPASVEMTSKQDAVNILHSNSISFPIICKSNHVVHATNNEIGVNSTQMKILSNEEELEGVDFPCFVQSFINHNAILWKVYVVGDEHFIRRRNSIKNLYSDSDQTPIIFSSRQISKATSKSPLSKLEAHELESHPTRMVNEGEVSRLVVGLRSLLQLDLFGFDLILENDSDRYAVIDINLFPSYDGVEELCDSMLRLFESKWSEDKGI